SLLLAGPVAWLTDSVLALVTHASSWRVSMLQLSQPPPLAWAAAALAAVAALFSGWFARRRAAAGCVGAGLLIWAASLQWSPASAAAATLTMIAVGDGSCFLLRVPGPGGTVMFDCGSGAYLDVGERSIVPTLRRLGV